MAKLTTVTTYAAILGAVIRQERSARKIEQQALGIKVGIGQSALSRIERGASPLSVDNLDRIGKVLNMSASDLLSKAQGGRKFLTTRGVKVTYGSPKALMDGFAVLSPQSLQTLLFNEKEEV